MRENGKKGLPSAAYFPPAKVARIENRVAPSLKPRDYQKTIFDIAKDENTIVTLPTNAGKTFISAMVIHHLLSGNWSKIAVFLTPTVVLAEQQESAISRDIESCYGGLHLRGPKGYEEETVKLPLASRCYTGDMSCRDQRLGVHWEDRSAWKELFEVLEASEKDIRKFQEESDFDSAQAAENAACALEHEWPRLFVVTAAKLLVWMQYGLLKVSDICLLVIDECHHCAPDSPVGMIMLQFYHRMLQTQPASLPRILALTASPLEKDPKTMESAIDQLKSVCDLFHSRIVTDTSCWTTDATEISVTSGKNSVTPPWTAILIQCVFSPLFEFLFDRGQAPSLRDVSEELKKSDLFASEVGLNVWDWSINGHSRTSEQRKICVDLRDQVRQYEKMIQIFNAINVGLEKCLESDLEVSSIKLEDTIKECLRSCNNQPPTMQERAAQWKRWYQQIVDLVEDIGAIGVHLLMVEWSRFAAKKLTSHASHYRRSAPLEYEPSSIRVSTNDLTIPTDNVDAVLRHDTPLRYMEYLSASYQMTMNRLGETLAVGEKKAVQHLSRSQVQVDTFCEARQKVFLPDPVEQVISSLFQSKLNSCAIVHKLVHDKDGAEAIDAIAQLLSPVIRVLKTNLHLAEKQLAANLWESFLCRHPQTLDWFLNGWRVSPRILIQRKLLYPKASSKIISDSVQKAEQCILQSLSKSAKRLRDSNPPSLCDTDQYFHTEELPLLNDKSNKALISTRRCPSKILMFVETRLKASLLAIYFARRSLIRVAWMTGRGKRKCGGNWLTPDETYMPSTTETQGFMEQQRIVERFRSNDWDDPSTLQLLIATSVIEEGFDLPKCNSVIRLDDAKTTRQHIQSKGRAREKQAQHINISNNGNAKTLEQLNITASVLRAACEAVQDYRPQEIKIGLKGLINEESGAIIPSTQATSVLANTLRAMAFAVDRKGLIAEPELRLWMRHKRLTDLDMLVHMRSDTLHTIEVPPVRGHLRHCVGPLVITHPGPRGLTKKRVASDCCLEALRQLQTAGVLDAHFKPPAPSPKLCLVPRGQVQKIPGKEAEEELHCEGVLRPLPRSLEYPTDGTYNMYHIYYCVTSWSSEILRSGGHFGRWRCYYSPSGEPPSFVTSLLKNCSSVEDFQSLREQQQDEEEDEDFEGSPKSAKFSKLDGKFRVLQKGRKCLMEFLRRSVALAQAASVTDQGLSENPLQVLQPLSILIKGRIEAPVRNYFVHWATNEIVKVELRPVSDISLSQAEINSLQTFRRLLLQFWRIFSLEPKEDDPELIPSHFLLAPLDSTTQLIDFEYVRGVQSHQAHLQLGNRRLEQSLHSSSFNFSSMRARLKTTFESFCASHCSSDAASSNHEQSNSNQSKPIESNSNQSKPIESNSNQSNPIESNSNQSNPIESEFCPEDLMKLLDHRGGESLVVRLCHEKIGEFNFFRVDDVAWDVPVGQTTVENGETLRKYYEEKFEIASDEKSELHDGVVSVSKLRQGPRVGLSGADHYTRHEVIHSSEICVLTMLTEPIVQQLSWVPSIVYILEKVTGFLEVMDPLTHDLKTEPVEYKVELDQDGNLELDEFSLDPFVTFNFDFLRKAFLVPSATQGDIETTILSQRLQACRVIENAVNLRKALASVNETKNINQLELDTDSVIINFIRKYDPDHLEPSYLPYRYTHSQILEFHGDAILKYLCAVYVFFRYPTAPEGYLSKESDKFKSNAALRAVATKTGLRNHITAKCFNLKSHGKGPRGTLLALRDQTISWKQQADVVEALLGALYWSQCDRIELWPCLGLQCALPRILKGTDLKRADLWSTAMSSHFIGNPNSLFICAQFMDMLFGLAADVSFCHIFSTLRNSIHAPEGYTELLQRSLDTKLSSGFIRWPVRSRLENSLLTLLFPVLPHAKNHSAAHLWFNTDEYVPVYPQLFEIARMHPSAKHSTGLDYQRLEYLGDAVLGLMLTEWLEKELPEFREGALTLSKSELQSNFCLARGFSKRLGTTRFSDFLICSGLELESVDALQLQLQATPHNFSRCPIRTHQGVKLLADVYEAMVGASLFEFNFDVTAVWFSIKEDFTFLLPRIKELLNDPDSMAVLLAEVHRS